MQDRNGAETLVETLLAGKVDVCFANPGTSAATYTLPTGALIDAAVPNATVGSTFDLSIVNIGTSSGAVTLAVSTGVTDGGNAVTAIAVTTSALFRFRKVADNTFVAYRIG